MANDITLITFLMNRLTLYNGKKLKSARPFCRTIHEKKKVKSIQSFPACGHCDLFFLPPLLFYCLLMFCGLKDLIQNPMLATGS